jgi:hypothetical protein
LKNLEVGGRLILKCMLWKWDGRVWVWISLFQDRQEWRAVVNTIMNHWVP